MKLSEAILAGCKKKPIKYKRDWFGPDGKSACVLGAACAAVGESNADIMTRVCGQYWPELFFYPNGGRSLYEDITEMNDESDKTREEIAAELAEQGY